MFHVQMFWFLRSVCQVEVHILPRVPEEVGDGTSCGTLEKDFFFFGCDIYKDLFSLLCTILD
jgi:hypothetical protein